MFSIEQQFQNCPKSAISSLNELVSFRKKIGKYRLNDGWQTIRGVDYTTPHHHYEGLIKAQLRRERRVYAYSCVRNLV